MRRYCLDSNALIEPWNKYYAPEIAPAYWSRIEELALQDVVFCSDEVRKELERQDDDLWKWAKERPGLFRATSTEIMLKVREVLSRCPMAIGQGQGKNAADPFVVALAMLEGAVVVTKEQTSSKKYKIPDVCQEFGVEWIPDYMFAREIQVRIQA